MQLNLNDASSILAWWKVWPARHNGYLDGLLATRPQFGAAIQEAQRQIAFSSELQALLTRSAQDERDRLAQEAAREGSRSSHELRWRELATAAA